VRAVLAPANVSPTKHARFNSPDALVAGPPVRSCHLGHRARHCPRRQPGATSLPIPTPARMPRLRQVISLVQCPQSSASANPATRAAAATPTSRYQMSSRVPLLRKELRSDARGQLPVVAPARSWPNPHPSNPPGHRVTSPSGASHPRISVSVDEP